MGTLKVRNEDAFVSHLMWNKAHTHTHAHTQDLFQDIALIGLQYKFLINIFIYKFNVDNK